MAVRMKEPCSSLSENLMTLREKEALRGLLLLGGASTLLNCVLLKPIEAKKPPKRYVCDECGEKFTQSGSLGTHIRVKHKNIRPFRCDRPGCRARPFGQRGDLNRHIASVHEGKKEHECMDCNELFSRRSALNRHRERKHLKSKHRSCTPLKIVPSIRRRKNYAY